MSTRLGCLFPIALLCGCPTPEPTPQPWDGPDTFAWPVDEAGPFEVGHILLETDYVMPTTGETRTIPFSVWYPTEDTEGDPAEGYGGFYDPSFEQATPAAPSHERGYPVLVYSHGHVMYPAASKFLMRHLASHGWVAAAPAHVGNTMDTAGEGELRPVGLWIDRAFDVSATLDALVDVELAGTLDLDHAVMAGHSFGGHTTWASAGGAFDIASIASFCDDPTRFVEGSCTQRVLDTFAGGAADARLVGAIALDGSGGEEWFGATGLGNIGIPMMQMYTDSDGSRIVPPERAPGVDLRDVQILGACHGTFSVSTSSSCPTIDPDRGRAIVQAYALTFARHVALGDATAGTTAVLEGDTVLDDLVRFAHHP